MVLFCVGCGQLHPFTPGGMERLVYALGAVENDLRARLAMDPSDTTDPTIGLRCLRDVLTLAHVDTVLSSQVDEMVRSRRASQRAAAVRGTDGLAAVLTGRQGKDPR